MMLADDRERYVALHRALGFKFRIQNGLLRSFVTFAAARGDSVVLAARVLEWAREAPSPAQRRNRLLTVRRFALSLHAEDTRHEIPAADAFGGARHTRVRPHIWSAEEIARLMKATIDLGPEGGIRPLTYRMIFGLLAATGLRISEALALRVRDVPRTASSFLARSSERAGSCRSTRRRVARSTPILPLIQASLRTRSSGRALGAGRPTRRWSRCSCGSPAPLVFAAGPVSLGRASTTSGTASPSDRSSGAAQIARRSSATWSASAPISGTPMSPTPTGICRRRRR